MKNYKVKNWMKALLSSCLVLVMVTGCKKDDDDGTESKTLSTVIAEDSDLSLLKYAIDKANLTATLNTASLDYTVFAPTNDAFTAAGLGTIAAIDTKTSTELSFIILYHCLTAKTNASAIATGDNSVTTMATTETSYLSKKSNGDVFINGAKVTKADINCNNGVIHKINKVILAAEDDIVELAIANPDLSYLVAAVLRANVQGALSAAGPLTVFAPTNAAFIAAGFPSIASINSADPTTLAAILTYHVVNSRAFSCDLTDGASVATLNPGKNVTVNTTSGVQLSGIGNGGNKSNVTSADNLATNGVVHIIDRVLLPQ